MEYAGYNFKLESKGYSENNEVVVRAKNYAEAEKLAQELIKGSKLKLGELRRVLDCRLSVQETNIVERKLIIDEHNVKHSGEITEYKVKGAKKK